MKHLFASLICVSLAASVVALSHDKAQLAAALRDRVANSQCTSKCQGDFPTSSERKYATAVQAHDWVGLILFRLRETAQSDVQERRMTPLTDRIILLA